MSLVNWYTDGEYVMSVDEIREYAWEDGRHPADYIISHGLKPAVCNLCDGALPADAPYPLCSRCESTAKAHARLENDARRYPDPEVRRG